MPSPLHWAGPACQTALGRDWYCRRNTRYAFYALQFQKQQRASTTGQTKQLEMDALRVFELVSSADEGKRQMESMLLQTCCYFMSRCAPRYTPRALGIYSLGDDKRRSGSNNGLAPPPQPSTPPHPHPPTDTSLRSAVSTRGTWLFVLLPIKAPAARHAYTGSPQCRQPPSMAP